jgi:DNA modification methylase
MMNLIHGDCIEKLQEIADGSIDLIVTDPPYGIDYQTFRTKREKPMMIISTGLLSLLDTVAGY